MHHTKLILFGIVLVVAIVTGFVFWDKLSFTQQEISNTPMPVNTGSNQKTMGGMSRSDSYDSIEKDLNETSLDIDSDTAELETELEGLE
jgi:hypothetical protein